jgi:MFS family permease
LLLTRDFALLFASQAVSQIGDGLSKVALLWFVYEITGSALKTTTIGLLQTLPPLVLGPFIGVYLDRWPKKRVMVWVDVIRAFILLSIPVLYVFGALSLGRLYALVFLTAIFSSVFGPALASSVPLIVSRMHLTNANALLQTTTNLGVLIGPAMGGLGVAVIGIQHVLFVNSAILMVSALCLLPMRMREVPRQKAASSRTSFARDLLAGFRFVFRQDPTVFALMITATLYTLSMSAFVFVLPVVAKLILQVGPVELGWLWSALGIGMLISSGGLAWARQGSVRGRLRLIAGSLFAGGGAICAFGFSQWTWVSIVLAILIGGSTALFMPIAWALLQERTPKSMLGRMFTMFSTAGMASAMIGMVAFGWTTDRFGPIVSLIGVGTFLLIAAGLAVFFTMRWGLEQRPAGSPSQLRLSV